MNDSKLGITRENLLLIVPPALTHDPAMMARAAADAEALEARLREIDRVRIYPDIAQLDEQLLDILAYDFKVDWWNADYSLEEKRRTLKTSWQVHKTLGTKGAVEKATSAVYPVSRVQEWFEYGGKPYHFRMDVDLPEDEWTPEKHRQLMWRLQYYKNLRSHLDYVIYHMKPVVLENRQAFWFTAMYIALRERNKNCAVQDSLSIKSGATQIQSFLFTTLKIAGIGVTEQLSAALALMIRAWVSNFRGGPIRFNGRRLMDGTFLFDQAEIITGPALASVTVTTGVVNRFSGRNLCLVEARYRAAAQLSSRLDKLVISAWASNFKRPVRFNGHRNMDGRFLFDQTETIPNPALNVVTICVNAINNFSSSAHMARDNVWMLNGAHKLNGKKKLNVGTERSAL